MVILITDGVGEENQGEVTVFCCHDQNEMQVSDVLSTLCQQHSPEPSVVMVRRYTNTLYILQGTSQLLYLDVGTLQGHFLHPVPYGPPTPTKATSIL